MSDTPTRAKAAAKTPARKTPARKAPAKKTPLKLVKQQTGSATFEQMLVDKLRPHPKNIRHEVTPSDELVSSIKQQGVLQPLVVAPHPTLDGDYTVIAGHHRLAAAKRAGLLVVPTVIRHDLLTDEHQVPAMMAENRHRKDLTISEEIDAVQLMLGFDGWDEKRVAKETGQSLSVVRSRAKLRNLSDKARTGLDTGQITLERAAALAEYDDHPDLQEKLLTAAFNASYHWEYELNAAEKAVAWRAERPEVRKDLEGQGIEIVDGPAEDESWYSDAYPYRRIAASTPEEAIKQGAKAVLDSEFPGVVYVVPEKAPEEDAAVDPREAEREQIHAEWRDLEEELTAAVEVEDTWVDGVVRAAGTGDEKTLGILCKYFSRTRVTYQGTQVSRRVGINEYLRPKPADYERLYGSLAPLEQWALEILLALQQNVNRRAFWNVQVEQASKQDRSEDTWDNQALTWFDVRHDLGWELLPVENKAVDLASRELDIKLRKS